MNRELFTNYHSVEADFGEQKLQLETGRIARQADGAAVATIGDTQVLATVVAQRSARPGQDFFPLTVNYQERMYASGRIPGSFFRREGRPSEKETLTSRLIDRPIRPLFPAGFRNEVQVICTVLSASRTQNPDIAAFAAASAALALSGIPFDGPVAASRVGYDAQKQLYQLNPDTALLETSALDMVVAGTKDAVLMVESQASQLSEDLMIGAVLFAHEQMQSVIDLVTELVGKAGVEHWPLPEPDPAVAEHLAKVSADCGADISKAYEITDKGQRRDRLADLKQKALDGLESEEEQDQLVNAFKQVEKQQVRRRILDKQPRIDGRNATEVRGLDIEVGVLPGAHGSALFTRGETQTIATATLGANRLQQMVEGLDGLAHDHFMLHYNFPPFSVGETGFMGGPKRREIGHGRLARRSLEAILPDEESFPYTLRVVSDITESNGSSSMASVCGASLAMMDAGVPVSGAVAGVAMGLVKEGDEFVVLTDIMGDEDHLGDMDFKVAGTHQGITALQMDIKIAGVTEEIMTTALAQARQAQLHILQAMDQVLAQPRPDISPRAPRAEIIQVAPDQVRAIIGKGGATIRAMQMETGAEIEVNDDGQVTVYGETEEARAQAIERIQSLTAEPEIGRVYSGQVERIMDFGAFVNILPGRDGLVHISEIGEGHIQDVSSVLSEGQAVEVKLLDIDERGRLRLSMKAVHASESDSPDDETEAPAEPAEQPEIGKVYTGEVVRITNFGAFVNILPGLDGLVHISEISDEYVEDVNDHLSEGQKVQVKLLDIDDRDRLRLSIKALAQPAPADAP